MASKAKNMHQALVVQKVDSTIQRINLYPLDSAIGFQKLIQWIVIFEQLGPEVYFPGGRGIVDPPSLVNLGTKFSETSFPHFKTYFTQIG